MNWVRSEDAVYSKTHLLHRRLAAMVLGKAATNSPESLEMAMRLVTLNLLAILLIPCFMIEFLVLGHHVLAGAIGLAGLVMLCSIPIYRFAGNLALARDTFVVSLFAFKAGETLYLGTFETPGIVWLTTMPVIGVLLGGARAGSIWLAITLAGLAGIFLFQELALFSTPQFWAAQFFPFSLACVVIALFIFVMMAELGRRKAVLGLEDASERMRHFAERDGLTELFNRRYVWEHLEEQESRTGDSSAIGLLLIDVDNFKAINDTLGHAAGDDILRHIARVIVSIAPETSVVGRYGGEEFIVVLHDEDVARAYDIAERMRLDIAASTPTILPDFLGATVSAGVSRMMPNEPFSIALDRADRALYLAKNSGRNRVAGARELSQIRFAG